MGCTSSTMRQTLPRLGKGDELLLECSSFVDAPASPASTATCNSSPKHATPLAVQPTRRLLHRRQRHEPHLDHHLTDRLDTLAQYIQMTPTSGYQKSIHAHTHKAINALQDHIKSFFVVYDAEKRPLWRLALTGRLVQQVESFHRSVDAVTARCGLAVVATSGTDPSLPRWQARWRRMRAERLAFFRIVLKDLEVAADFTSDQPELLALLKHGAQKFDTVLTADESELLARTFDVIAKFCSNADDHATPMLLMPLPDWFIAPYERHKQQLKYQRAAVQVLEAPRALTSSECFDLATVWSRLHHQHVMKLFGACHVGQSRFVVVAKGTPLNQCFGDAGFPLWQAFYEAALALRYLHDRQIGFDSLSCADLILYRGENRDFVMLAGFGLRRMKYDARLRHGSCVGSTRKNWQAPELLNGSSLAPTEASDIFALGMCVVEAFSGGNVWGDHALGTQNSDDYYDASQSSNAVPPRPTALDESWQWALVKRMCSLDVRRRPSLTEVLTTFEVFAQDEEAAGTNFSSTERGKTFRRHFMRHTKPRATFTSIACALREVLAWCDEVPEVSALNFQLYERMEDLAARLETIGADRAASQLSELSAVILCFRDLLQRQFAHPLLRLAATRQVIEMNVELHSTLDVLMDRLRYNRSGASIHMWKDQQALYCQQLRKRLRLTLTEDAHTMIGELNDDQDFLLLGVLLAFEAKQRSASYADEEQTLLQNAFTRVKEIYYSTMHEPTPDKLILPQWFVPPYEVLFNDVNAFNRAGFGSVHCGKWLNSDVVIKKFLTFEESKTVAAYVQTDNSAKDFYTCFNDDMSVWSSLEHPNVLKLVGACHVGPHRFSLCEYAAQGTIDSFVASKAAEERSGLAYRLLHDAALGLLYLHTQNIVHADLRSNNILIDAKGVVRLTDFGFSSMKKSRRSSGAISSHKFAESEIQWSAPECLDGSSPTFASNVYSFAMCIIAVVSGELPWGYEMTAIAVRSKVRKGLVPPRRADCFPDSKWAFIKRMCCHDPKKRITMVEVVKFLENFVE